MDIPRRSGFALLTLVDVGGRQGRGLVVALEADEGDVVADDVLPGVDAVAVVADGALEAAGEGVVAVDDLVGGRDHVVGRGELEGTGAPVGLPVAAALLAPDHLGEVVGDPHGGGGDGGREDDGEEGELHFECGVCGSECVIDFW